MDPFGTVLFVGSISSLLLALQLGGQTYPWSSGRIIALLTLFGVIIIAWICWQVYLGPIATIPKNVISQRSMAFASWYSFAQGGVNFGVIYYAPLWFQAVRGASPLQSGLDVVTFFAGQTVVLLILGYILTKGGYSAPFMIASVTVVSVSVGLFTTWTPGASDGRVFGYLALYGVGQGLGWQQPSLIAQTVLPAVDISTGTALASVTKLLGATISLSVGQTLFNNRFKQLVIERIPTVDPDTLVTLGADQLRSEVDPSLIPIVAAAYNDALKHVWYLLLAFSLVALFGALGVEWRSVTDKVANQSPPPVPPQSASTLEPPFNLSDVKPKESFGTQSTQTLVVNDPEDVPVPPLPLNEMGYTKSN